MKKGARDAEGGDTEASSQESGSEQDADIAEMAAFSLQNEDTSTAKDVVAEKPSEPAATTKDEVTPQDVAMTSVPEKPVVERTGNIVRTETALEGVTKSIVPGVPNTEEPSLHEAPVETAQESSVPNDILDEVVSQEAGFKEGEGDAAKADFNDCGPETSDTTQNAIEAQIFQEMNVQPKEHGATAGNDKDASHESTEGAAGHTYVLISESTPAGTGMESIHAVIPHSLETDTSVQDAAESIAGEGRLSHGIPAATNEGHPTY